MPGRKKRSTAEKLKVIVWYKELELHTSLSSRDMELNFTNKSTREKEEFIKIELSNLWQKYKLGKHTPKSNRINQIAERYPKTKKVIQHPIWTLLVERPITWEEIPILMKRCRPDLLEVVGGGTWSQLANRSKLGHESLNELCDIDGYIVNNKYLDILNNFTALMAIAINAYGNLQYDLWKDTVSKMTMVALKLANSIFLSCKTEFLYLYNLTYLKGFGELSYKIDQKELPNEGRLVGRMRCLGPRWKTIYR